jgi:hypothetical protein
MSPVCEPPTYSLQPPKPPPKPPPISFFPSRGPCPYQPPTRPMSAIFISPSWLVEIAIVLRSLSNNKAPRVDRVAIELLKFEGPDALQWMHSLIIIVWKSGVVPSQWKCAHIVMLHKGGHHIMANYYGISMLDVLARCTLPCYANTCSPMWKQS